jgi:hypothetical protein
VHSVFAETLPTWQHAKQNQTGEPKKRKKNKECGTAQDFGQAWRTTRMNVKFLSILIYLYFILLNKIIILLISKLRGVAGGATINHRRMTLLWVTRDVSSPSRQWQQRADRDHITETQIFMWWLDLQRRQWPSK